MKILLTNDDGLDSPALHPSLSMLAKVGTVSAVVPRYQQSWTSKANTRRSEGIAKEIHEIGDFEVTTLEALPADCSNYGIFRDRPDILVSGANVGHNLGLSALFSSGTIGAAFEGLFVGIPSIALSIPYNRGSPLESSDFVKSLQGFDRFVSVFGEDRPQQVGMAIVNLPYGRVGQSLLATELATYHYGALFDDTTDVVAPKHYYDLSYPAYGDTEPGSDAHARSQNMGSVVLLDWNAQLVDVRITEKWIIDNHLSVLR